ncbi:NAD-binding protein [Fomitiporia mediterranea MF3/22]|uniref:NAD-binding protein n=1 Tax=Fomitiporia mediterranea (strain MF3/22) TaxID=694068 RepID=UPI00044079DE|nr:NAD-binding protein [Fomitiporia mediterranea MF3/22]EJC99857.1 NAD-binding protein [Fomitiporia mediterranea MF3/22]
MAQDPRSSLSVPLTLIGVDAALRAASNSDSCSTPKATLLEEEFSLSGSVAVVTGGQRGLGLEMAEALAEAGATVYCLDLPAEPDKSFGLTQEYVSKLGLPSGCLEYAAMDVTDQKGMWGIIEEIAEKEGRLDVCVVCAGLTNGDSCLEMSAEEFQKIMDVNVNGVFYTAQAAARQMIKLGNSGSIILISSTAGRVAVKGKLAYSASKAAEIQMARSLACELGPHRIRVNTLSPGYIRTAQMAEFLDMNPEIEKEWSSQSLLGRIGRPHELRGAIVWLASDASSFCTGSDIAINGGHYA